MLAEVVVFSEVLEAGMLICFGLSWPVDILKQLRTRRTEGKSLAFMTLIVVGYVLGVGAKLVCASRACEPVKPTIWLYALNALLVTIDILLYLRFRPRKA